jgi:transcriptional regulator with GAF, ATPase, and Fis domain
LIGATDRDLEAEVKAGRFREDLYYRLHVFPIKLPPLRERKEGIPLLAEHFVAKLNNSNGKSVQGFSSDGLERLQRYPFPGKVRKLENLEAMQRAGGVQTVAASRLGITRRKLHCALEKHGLWKLRFSLRLPSFTRIARQSCCQS